MLKVIHIAILSLYKCIVGLLYHDSVSLCCIFQIIRIEYTYTKLAAYFLLPFTIHCNKSVKKPICHAHYCKKYDIFIVLGKEQLPDHYNDLLV